MDFGLRHACLQVQRTDLWITVTCKRNLVQMLLLWIKGGTNQHHRSTLDGMYMLVTLQFFVLVMVTTDHSRLRRALINVDVKPMDHPHSILLQYWKPSTSSDHIQETYDGWDGERSMQWRIDDTQPPVQEHMNSIMFAWKLGIREGTRNPTMKKSFMQVIVIKESLALLDP